jgi:hypothetical protein
LQKGAAALFRHELNFHYFCNDLLSGLIILIMSLQIIEDSKGKTTGVFIPINDWKRLKKQYKNLGELEYVEPGKAQLLQELREAVIELKLVEQGKLKARPAKELLSEL